MKRKITNKERIIYPCICLASSFSFATQAKDVIPVKQAKPNIIFILADDLGWGDTQLYGSTKLYETPNVMRFAERGITFNNAYSSGPMCSPSRGAIMSGLNPARTGLLDAAGHLEVVRLKAEMPANPAGPAWNRSASPASATRLDTSYTTLAEELRSYGYATGHFGKWHLGREPYDPLHQGFDVDLPHYSGCCQPPGGYFAPWKWTPEVTYDQGKPGEFIDDRMASEVIRFMAKNKDKDKPFFCNWWTYSIHGGPQTTPALQKKYEKKIASLPTDYPQRHPLTAGLVEEWDAAIGKVLNAIDSLGIANNTIIVLGSDNGGWVWPSGKLKDVNMSSNAPLRSGKSSIYEGGTRVPLVIIWPGHVKPGSKTDAIFTGTDFYPTLLAMIDKKPRPGAALDGVNQVPALLGESGSREVICYIPFPGRDYNGPGAWVRKGDWKLLVRFDRNNDFSDKLELFNLKEDVGENNNLASTYPHKAHELEKILREQLKGYKAVLPVKNPKFDPKAEVPN
ncbi:MAG: sulfatase [Bacteroidetes bacterium]|nr:sulfatase [Bacteroidota bacterium]